MSVGRKRQIGGQPRGVDPTRLRRAEDGLLDNKQIGSGLTLDRQRRLALDTVSEANRIRAIVDEMIAGGTAVSGGTTTSGGSVFESTSGGGGTGGTTVVQDVDRLEDIGDCARLGSATDGQVPSWVAAQSRWEPVTVSGGGGTTNLDGGDATSTYGGTTSIDGGTA